MPRQLKTGDTVNGYTITRHLNTGAMANAFAATDRAGNKVFFKSYKSPTCAVKWYRDYMVYQKEVKRRLENHLVGKFCVRLLDQFEFKFGVPTFFQVFEFVQSGEDLEQILNKLRESPEALDWNKRLILAKVMMAAIHQLHDAKIVHGDLKPPNLQLFRDESIEAGYQLKLIDMDFSILTDQRAPWHGHSAYVGSPGYFSPEHLEGGRTVPEPASDIFTCALILYELLAQGHPYRCDTEGDYLTAARSHRAKRPVFQGEINRDARLTERFGGILHQCLAPRTSDRPSAKDVHLALNGETAGKPEPPRVSRVEPPILTPMAGNSLRIGNAIGTIEVGVTTPFGKQLLCKFGDDAQFADDLQFTIERRDGHWWVVPPPFRTLNATLLNGACLEDAKQLRHGDQLALGSRTSAKVVLQLKLTIV